MRMTHIVYVDPSRGQRLTWGPPDILHARARVSRSPSHRAPQSANRAHRRRLAARDRGSHQRRRRHGGGGRAPGARSGRPRDRAHRSGLPGGRTPRLRRSGELRAPRRARRQRMSPDLRDAPGAGRRRHRGRPPGAREKSGGRGRRRQRRRRGDGPRAGGAAGLRPGHRGERYHAIRARGAVPRTDARRRDGPRVLLRPSEAAGRQLRRGDPSQGGARGADGVHAHEGGHRHQARAEHHHHRRHDPYGARLRQPDGRPDGLERQAARPGRAHRDGVLRGGPRGRAGRDRGCGRLGQARDRDGEKRHRESRGGTLAAAGGRVRAARGRRPSARDPGARPAMTSCLAVGLMSGTSLDGVSTALVRLSDDPLAAQLVAFRQEPYTAAERGAVIDAIARGRAHDLSMLHVALGERFAGAVLQLLAGARVAPRDLAFIASHGQTIWHEPGRATLQLGDPAVIAERVGVRVVSDFRSRDVAAGGAGAAPVPPPGGVAFDTGPGVAVIDAVTRRVDPDAPYDQDGERARRGHPDLKALHQLLTDPFFDQPPPKSTGRERFGIEFADRLIALVHGAGGSANDAVATATALTAETVARGIERWTPPPAPAGGDELVISGGGARNPALVELLAGRVRPRPVVPFAQLFFDGEAKEALAFAFLGFLTLAGKPGNLPAATGARGPRVLGSVTPA